jgi:hypothetical protein
LRFWCCSKSCSKSRAPCGLAGRRGDGVTRDETAWTSWTLPPAIAGCPARRYRKGIPVSSHSCWTSGNLRNPGLGQGRQRLVLAARVCNRPIRHAIRSCLAVHTSPPNWPFCCARDLGPGIPDRGPCSWSWGGACAHPAGRWLSAGGGADAGCRAPGGSLPREVSGQRTGAGDHPYRRRRRERPVPACTARPSVP